MTLINLAACEATFHPARYPRDSYPQGLEPVSVDYQTKVQKVLDRRCVVCHSCFTAPCQLNLAAFEGVDRGASKSEVYDSSRLKSIHPTRLFEDARTAREWQTRFDFFPVVDHAGHTNSEFDHSIFYQLLVHKSLHPTALAHYDKEAKRSCPKNSDELQSWLKGQPESGMPLGFPQLDGQDNRTLIGWLRDGAPGPNDEARLSLTQPTNGAQGQKVLQKWEAFLNQPGNKTRISARYIYEHLFMAHIQFDEIPGDNFRLVRSRSAWPNPVNEITTVRPFDSPETAVFSYRFLKYSATIVRKNHVPYRLNDAKMIRLSKLFLESDWGMLEPPLPSYERESSANPFVTFKDLPARSRYQFMLDDAYYHVMTFIYGPVCKGNVALNVIQAHFNILFLKPAADPTVTDPAFLLEAGKDLSLPSDGESRISAALDAYKGHQEAYQRKRLKLYAKAATTGRLLSDLWDGEGVNDNAILTVYRHYDSADVITGAFGGVPKTTWVMDYPIFERIYYDLVAGFDVYGNVIHQTATRRYMDNLRTESEDLFLSFLPKQSRPSLRDSWYRGKLSKEDQDSRDPYYKSLPETRIRFKNPTHAREEFLNKALKERFNAKVRGKIDHLNQKNSPIHLATSAFEKRLTQLTLVREPFVQTLPEVTFVRVRGENGVNQAYTFFRNQEHLNVSFMFREQNYREPAADSINIFPGLIGSYPNFFFDVPFMQADKFISSLRSVHINDDSFKNLVDHFGVRRMDPRFWELADWFADVSEKNHEGLLDLSRYENF